jgi:hypothetical protein
MLSLGQVAYNLISLEININNNTGRFNAEKNDLFRRIPLLYILNLTFYFNLDTSVSRK